MKKCGYIAIIGLPNAGKSTLLNALLGTKVSIVCHKVQTTRSRITGILTAEENQAIFIDTPGLFEAKRLLEKAMVRTAWSAIHEAGAIVLVVDASRRKALELHLSTLEKLSSLNKKLIIVFNKVDLIKKIHLLPLAEAFSKIENFDRLFMISASQGSGLEDLKTYLLKSLPEGEWLYPEDQLADISSRLLAAELTREQVFHLLHDELPYNITVITEKWIEEPGRLHIMQVIYVAKDQHKAMVLGAGGSKIKAIGTKARIGIEETFGKKVHLDLHVLVQSNWIEEKSFYDEMGLEFKP